MKKIILIMISFIFILSGCSSYTEEDLIDSGYRLNEETNRMEIVWNGNSSVYVELDDNGEPSAIGMDYNITTLQKLDLRYVIKDEVWSATYSLDGEVVEVEAKDAYAYMKEGPAVDMALELENLANDTNISMQDLENGSPQPINELIEPDVVLSNVEIVDSTYSNPEDEEDFLYAMHYIKVNFDLTNNTGKELSLEGAKVDICYEIVSSSECSELQNVEAGDTNLTTTVLKPGETLNIQLQAVVPVDAIEYGINIFFEDTTMISHIIAE